MARGNGSLEECIDKHLAPLSERIFCCQSTTYLLANLLGLEWVGTQETLLGMEGVGTQENLLRNHANMQQRTIFFPHEGIEEIR